MGKGGENITSERSQEKLTWTEVQKHSNRADKWIVVDGEVYDVTKWSRRHPGGSSVITHYAGQDATEAFRAFHRDEAMVRKFLKPLHVGSLHQPAEVKHEEIKKDMDQLRVTATKMGLFKPSVLFFVLSMLQLIGLELFAFWVVYTYGNGWIPFTLALISLSTLQAQAGWIQHDYGHLSVFKSSFWNHFFHQFTMNTMKGASASWWNHMHYQHHAKPNVLDKDPDVRLDMLFVVGDKMAERNSHKKNSMPYDWQHRYWFAIGPPLLFPVYFQYMIFRHCISWRAYVDLCTMFLFYGRFLFLWGNMIGFINAVGFYFLIRVVESHWFVWVSQSNHIPMEIDEDKAAPWLPLQLTATCNVEKGVFNDWFTGHLNFQIEHHLFPTMPRHNLYKIAPLAKSLCEKHNIPYVVKPLYTAFKDVVGTLKSSGQIWSAYYHAYNMD